MTVLELEKESRLESKDIQDISNYIFSFIHVDPPVIDETTVPVINNFLSSTADFLEKRLTSGDIISKKEKLEIVHLLTKLKANKEYIGIINKTSGESKQAIADLKIASERMFKKSQSAFGEG